MQQDSKKDQEFDSCSEQEQEGVETFRPSLLMSVNDINQTSFSLLTLYFLVSPKYV